MENDPLIEIYELRELNRKLDADNYHLKRQLLNKNDEIRKLNKIINSLKVKLNSKNKDRYKNRKR